MMKRFAMTMILAAAVLGSTAITKIASAQEILLEGPLAGEPAVRKLTQYRKMRFSIGPQVGHTILTHHYMHNIMIGGRLEFNLTDWLGIGGLGYYSVSFPTKLTNHITDAKNIGDESTVPSDSNYPSYTGSANFEDQVARLRAMVLGQVSLVPFRGKISLFEKLFAAIDWEIFGGGGVVMYDERAFCGLTSSDSRCPDYKDPETGILYDPDDYKPELEGRVAGVFTVGTGIKIYANDWLGIHFEYRVTPFKWNESGTDEAGQSGSQWQQRVNEDGSGYIWSYEYGTGDGDYPDGKIDKQDRRWNPNMSIALGFLVHLPFKPSIAR